MDDDGSRAATDPDFSRFGQALGVQSPLRSPLKFSGRATAMSRLRWFLQRGPAQPQRSIQIYGVQAAV